MGSASPTDTFPPGHPVTVVGYATAVRASTRDGRSLFLHAGHATYQLLPSRRVAETGGLARLPLGPHHRLRVYGRIESEPPLPTLRVVEVEVLAGGQGGRGEETPD